MTIWQPGMRCVCIQEQMVVASFAIRPLIVGTVYTVRYVGACCMTGVPLLQLDEIDNRHLIGTYVKVSGRWWALDREPAYDARCFRPLSETRLDQFRAHLAPTPRQKADA